jgi:hypothetical protein
MHAIASEMAAPHLPKPGEYRQPTETKLAFQTLPLSRSSRAQSSKLADNGTGPVEREMVMFKGTVLMLAGVIAVMGLGGSTARADKLDDYKKAQSEKYCDSIPDSNRKSECKEAQGNAKDFCDETTCNGLSYKDRQNLANTKKQTIAGLENEIRELDSKVSSASNEDDRKRFEYDRDGKKRDLESVSRDLASLQKEIDETIIQIKGRIEKGQRCRHYRIEVQRIFLNAQKDAESDAQSDPEIKKIAMNDLIPHWTDEGSKHAQAIVDSQTGLDKCTERLEGQN